MDEPAPLSRSAREALSAFGASTRAPLTQAERAAVFRNAARAPRAPRWQLVLLASATASFVIATAAFRFVGARGPEVEVVAARGPAEWKRAGELVTVRAGQVRVAPRTMTKVRTPQLEATVFGSVALFDVTPAGTVLSVEKGEVAWRTRTRSGTVAAGRTMTIAAAPKAVLAVEASAPAVEGCPEGAPGREACLTQRAAGTGLAAEFALYGLAMAARDRGAFGESARLFQSYADRFPAGTFAPEASIGRMVDLARAGQADDARAEAEAFGQRFPEDPRAADVAQWREELP